MEQILTLVLPVFGVMLCGYVVGKLKILGQESSHALNAFVYYVAMPIMLFQAMAGTDIIGLWDSSFIAIFIVPQLVIHLLYVLAARHLFNQGFKEALLAGMAASWGNTMYMGFPIVVTTLGEQAIAAVVIIAVVQTLVFMVGTLVILDISENKADVSIARAISRGFLSFAKNPAMLAAMAGTLVSVTSLTLHPALTSFVGMLSPVAAPCALFAIGLFLTTQRLTRGLGEVSIITLLKLVVSPALVIAMAYLVIAWGSTVSELWIKAAILLAATPTGTLVFVIAQKHHTAEQRASGAILVSSIVSVVTISLLIGWL